IALAQPAAQYEAMLLADGEPKRSWLFQGVDDSRPILAFDLDTGAQLPWAYSLPARCLALFYPADRELSVEGDAQVLEEYERLPRGWTSYRGQAWDLRQARALTLASPTRETLTVTLRVDEGAQRPFLEEGRLLSAGKPGTAAPVYLGAPPRIRIPLSGRRALEEELALWRVMIQNRWAASPELQRTQTLAELRDQAAAGDGYVDLLLHHPGLLGQTPFGNYQVRLRGPLGRDADLSLRMVPYLDVSGHQDLYLPDPTAGPQPALLQVEALAEYGLECQGEDGDCHLKEIGQVGSKRRYEVEADPGVTAVDVTLLKALPTGDVVRVPVPVPIRRLRWSLADEGAAVGQREWSGVAIKQSVDAFLEAHAPCLLVDLPIQDLDPVQLQLRLVDVDGVERQVLESPPPRRGQQRWRFELGAFADTVRHAWQSPTLRFELVAYGLQSEKKGLYWPVLSLTRPLLVENVSLTVRRAGKRAAFELRWHEPRPLRNRVVRFWPLWRPWDPVFEQPIPDDADGAFTFDAPHDRLRSGKVRLEFLVVDPWVPQEAVKPTAGSPGTVEVELISAKKQLQALDNRLEGHEDLLQIDERVSELVRELQQRLRAFDSLYEERALVLEEESVLLPELLDATVEFHNVLTAGFEQYRFHKSCRQSCADSPAQGAGAAPFRKPKTPAILSFDMNALEAAGDRHTEAVRRFKAVVSAESFCQEISNAFGELTRQLSDGTEADIELARNNIEIERRKVVARASNAGETLGKIRSAQQPQRAVLAQAVRELNTNLKQWVVAVRDGGKKHSEYLEEVKSKVMRFLDKLRKARRQGDFSDPEIDQYWAGIEARVLEGAEEIENLLQSGLVAEKDRDRASQAGKLKQHFELLLERAVIYADMGDLEKAQADAQWCYENLDVGTVPEILSLVDLVGSTRDTSTMRALQLKMFAASRFEPILRAREAGTLPQEQFDAYLANLPRSGLVPLTTCRLLLTVDDETARLHAVQQLLTRESPDGVEAVLSWVEAATMSDDDAISLLTQKPDFAAEALRAREGRPTADRLLQAFSQKAENVVRVGSWLRCNLGWGRIDGIEHRDSGASVRWCIGGSSPYRLTVTLRP
ncbi:MAG: hypothetical protein JXA14_27320, partial [Anaerolineae bacterium]|nr:hypothetical protein [Anaerolineae bacterium]